MAELDLDEYRGLKDGLIRKMVSGGAVLIAPLTADLPDKLTGPNGGLATLPDGWKPLGRIAKGAAPRFSPERQTEDVETWGELEPSRTDLIRSKMNVSVTLHDTRREVLELAARKSLEDVTPDESGEISFTNETAPSMQGVRALFLGVDGTGDNAFYIAKLFPRFTVDIGDEGWGTDAEVSYPLTGTATLDAKAGFSCKNFYAGPGAKKLMEEMGFSTP